MNKNCEEDEERLRRFGVKEEESRWERWKSGGGWIHSDVETAGWTRKERNNMSRMSEKLRVVRILGLLLRVRCGTRGV